MATLAFYYDVVCPFAYVASTRVRALAREAGVGLEYRPILLGGVLKAVGSPDRPMDVMPAAKARLTVLDAYRQADRARVPLAYPAAHPRRSVAAMRLLHAVSPDRVPALTDALYRAYWVEGRDIADLDVLQDVAEPYDVDVRAANASPAVRDALFDATDRAVRDGVFGVPTFRLGDRLWWGNDRIEFVCAELGIPSDAPEHTLSPVKRHHVAFFHDFSSPFSYLGSTRIGEVASACGATLEWVPFLLGALFKQIGTPLVPISTFGEARRQYALRDMREWAAWHDVPFRFPSNFPIRTVTALRVALVEPEATPHLYRAAWAEDRDISRADVIRGVLDEAGFDGAGLLAHADDEATRARLHANTARAIASGVCGAPSFLVDGEHLFWGQDRLAMVTEALSGWRPPVPEPLLHP